jgi:single-strand DNA-binding protein
MASFNRVILVGNLTRDVDLRHTPGGMAVTDLGLAVNHKYKNQQGEMVEEVTFVDITMWGRQAEICSEYLSKGSSVLIEGRLKLDSWEKEGKKNYKLRVVGETMQMLGSRGGGGGGGGGRGSQPQHYDESEAGGGFSDPGEAPASGGGGGGGRAEGDEIPF